MNNKPIYDEENYEYLFGEIEKRSEYIKSWNLRYFWIRCEYNEILYYKNIPNNLNLAINKPNGIIKLNNYYLQPYKSSRKNRCCLVLRHKKKSSIYLAVLPKYYHIWWKTLTLAIDYKKINKISSNHVINDLHKATFNGNYDIVKNILNNYENIDINKVDLHGNTPLHIAVMCGYQEIVKLLIEYNASTTIRNHSKWTALNEATSRGDREMIRLLWQERSLNMETFLKDRGSLLLGHFACVEDFELVLNWKFSSWLPLVSNLCPCDTWIIRKRGCSLRIDTTIKGFDFPTWKKGNMSFIFQLIDLDKKQQQQQQQSIVVKNNDIIKNEMKNDNEIIKNEMKKNINNEMKKTNNKLKNINRLERAQTMTNLNIIPSKLNHHRNHLHSSNNIAEIVNIEPIRTPKFLKQVKPLKIQDQWQLSIVMDHENETYTILHESPDGHLLKSRGESEIKIINDNNNNNKDDDDNDDNEIETLEDNIDLIMCSEMSHVQLSHKVKFHKESIGKQVHQYSNCIKYKSLVTLEILKRREHLTAEQIKANKEILETVRNPVKLTNSVRQLEDNDKPIVPSLSPSSSSRSVLATALNRGKKKHEPNLAPPIMPINMITEKEYFSHQLKRIMKTPPHLGRDLKLKLKYKNIQPTIYMCENFPLSLDIFIEILELISSQLPHVVVVKEFLESELPNGFPVKLQIPIFATIGVTLSVKQFKFTNITEEMFEIPITYRHDSTKFNFLFKDADNIE